ncbi:MAG TPA: hypothetical protein VJQ83_09155, partial [Tepidiformaceae bacterium]|nr:hypothetical protein [Tepidiformaceae bacterium]
FRYDDNMKGVMADVTVKVDQLLKGDAPDGIVRLTQDGGPTKHFSNGVVYLKQDDIDPILLDGDRVVLFLQPSDVEGWEPWFSQGWSGQYLVDDANQLRSTEGNAFAAEVDGLSLDSFLARVRNLVAGG